LTNTELFGREMIPRVRELVGAAAPAAVGN
jgi:hypothetical protein